MKFLIIFSVFCSFAAVSNAQVRCRNPGSLEIPVGPCCNQIAGQGLSGAVHGIMSLMDVDCKVNMFFDAVVSDPDMLAFYNYITGPEFTQMVLNVHRMPEFAEFMSYLCKELDFDFYLYLNTLGDILGMPRFPHPDGPHCHPNFPVPWNYPKTNVNVKSRKSSPVPAVSGVRRFFDELYEEIPSDAMYDLWLWKIDNDPYLCRGFLKLSHPNFVAIATAMENDPAFIVFVDKLEEWGMEMHQWIADFKEFLWYSSYCR